MCEPRSGNIRPQSIDDLDQAAAEPAPTDTPAVRRWKLRLSDRLSMGTLSATGISAYLLWSVVQGFDDMRITLREQATAIQSINVTLERVQDNQRESNNRYLAWETQTGIRFGEIDGRLSVLRRDHEDAQRQARDHDARLRILETERRPIASTPRR